MTEKHHRSSIHDVARLAGVSIGTVSNALSGKRPVAEATRIRIEQAIETLNYQPNLLASGLVNQRSHVISVVVKELRDLGLYGYSSAMEGIQQAANQLGYSIMLHFVKDERLEEIQTVLNAISARKVDGIVWAIHEFNQNHDWVQQVDRAQYPPMIFLHMHPDPLLEVATVDNQSGAESAVAHLIAQGAKKIGIITGPAGWWETEARLAGWKTALKQAGLNATDTWVATGDWSAESGKTAMTDLLAQMPAIDAVFASNDSMALGAMHTAYERGLRIPADVLLAGFDNSPEASSYWPGLTSVKQDLTRLGELSVSRLQDLIDARLTGTVLEPASQILLPTTLVIRESSLKKEKSDPVEKN